MPIYLFGIKLFLSSLNILDHTARYVINVKRNSKHRLQNTVQALTGENRTLTCSHQSAEQILKLHS